MSPAKLLSALSQSTQSTVSSFSTQDSSYFPVQFTNPSSQGLNTGLTQGESNIIWANPTPTKALCQLQSCLIIGTAKAGLDMLTKMMGFELGPHKV